MTTTLHEEMIAFFVETLRPHEFEGLSPEAFFREGENLVSIMPWAEVERGVDVVAHPGS
ncbi:MAG TPA: hypothetical protein VGX71_10280 [Pseudaminobacter sp.]|nr:hypothetical protein [Pseudaminobacter sp.]